MSTKVSKCIIGAGGFAREILADYMGTYGKELPMYVESKYMTDYTHDLSTLDFDKYDVLVAIADPHVRKRIVESLPFSTKFWTYISQHSVIMSNVNVGEGSIICAGTILTDNIYIGSHSHLNLLTTIGHDTYVGDYFTSAPGAKVSGNCTIGECVHVGTNSSIKENLSITDNVTIGLNTGVVKSITKEGIYGGVPAKLIK